jgi:acyl carrier protein
MRLVHAPLSIIPKPAGCRSRRHLYNAADGIAIVMPDVRSRDTKTKLTPMPDKASLMQQPAPQADIHLERELAALFVQALNLEIAPQDIDAGAPLYGEGLGLDSIDILEVALVVSKKYGVQLRADSQENHKIFRSLRHLAEYIAKQRSK